MRDFFASSLLKGHDPRPRIKQALRDLYPGAQSLQVSQTAVCNNGCISVNDVVRCRFDARCVNDADFVMAKLLVNFTVDGVARVVVSRWRTVERGSPDPRVSQHHVEDNVVVLPLTDVVGSVHFRLSDDGTRSSVYVPWEFRQ